MLIDSKLDGCCAVCGHFYNFDLRKMDRVLGCIIGAFMFLPWRPVVALLAAIWFVNISDVELYDWIDGLGHGIFFLPNLVRHCFDSGVLFKATNYTTGYNVTWWIASICSCIGWLVDACFSFMKACAFLGSDKR